MGFAYNLQCFVQCISGCRKHFYFSAWTAFILQKSHGRYVHSPCSLPHKCHSVCIKKESSVNQHFSLDIAFVVLWFRSEYYHFCKFCFTKGLCIQNSTEMYTEMYKASAPLNVMYQNSTLECNVFISEFINLICLNVLP